MIPVRVILLIIDHSREPKARPAVICLRLVALCDRTTTWIVSTYAISGAHPPASKRREERILKMSFQAF